MGAFYMKGYDYIATDIGHGDESDFLTYTPPGEFDCIVTNPRIAPKA